MCGIAGIWSSTSADDNKRLLPMMTKSIAHRGPDGEGFWYSADQSVALGHRRLSILDLSNNAAQPMSWLEKYVLTFNGEIYNYIEIRDLLKSKGYFFKSDSDTEVVLAAYHEWGKDCINRFDGMFAIALYDIEKNELFCARDRFGEKPFYFAFYNGNFVFASEMKALWAYGLPKIPNEKMVYNFLVNDLVENPKNQTETFYKNIFKLQSSHCFYYKGNGVVHQERYWQINTKTTADLTTNQVSQRFRDLLETSVSRRLRSDVAVGSSLSGGLDSSTIVGLISELSDSNHTFSARFKGSDKDEGQYIDLVTQKFATNHDNIFVDEQQFIDQLDKLMYHQEEPFQTGSIFAQYCVYQEARKNGVLVMMDGQGADELLGGYDKDFKFYLRELFFQKRAANNFIKAIKDKHNYSLSLSKKEQISAISPSFYKTIASLKHKINPQYPLGITKEFEANFSPKESPFSEFGDLKSMLKYELTNQGLEKLLKFADRNSMAHSVEVRLPFLSHELVEFIFSLKSSLFLEDGWSKAILRNSVKDLLPKEIVYRKDKIGFEAPHNQWLKNPILQEQYKASFDYLRKEKILNDNYTNNWKVLIAAKFLQG